MERSPEDSYPQRAIIRIKIFCPHLADGDMALSEVAGLPPCEGNHIGIRVDGEHLVEMPGHNLENLACAAACVQKTPLAV